MAPVNDNFADAIDLGWPLPPTVPGTTEGATLEAGEANFGQPTMGKTVWYKFTPTTGTQLTMMSDTNPVGGTIYDQWAMMTALYQVTPNGLTGITNSDLIGGFASSYMQAVVVPGATYYLQIGGDSATFSSWGYSGAFTLVLSALVTTLAPANDDFENASDFGWPPAYAYGYTGMATTEAGEPLPGGMTHTVWFTFVAAQTGTISFGFRNSQYYAHRLVIYRGEALGGLTLLSGPGTPVSAAVTAGLTYYLQLGFPGGYVGNSPSYELNSTFTLPASETVVLHNAFVFAVDGDLHPISSYDGLRYFRRISGFAYMGGTTLEPGEPQPSGFALGNTCWYSFHSDVRCKCEVIAYGNNFTWPCGVAVYTGDSLGSLTEVFSHQAAGFTPYTFIAEADTIYYAQVGRVGGQAVMSTSQYHQFGVMPRPIAANDDWADAENIGLVVGGTVTRGGPFNGAGVEYLPVREPMPSAADTGPSLWYKFTAPGSTQVTIEMIPGPSGYYGRAWDSVLGVYTGSALDALTEVASNDDYLGMGYASRLTLSVSGGTTYYVQAAILENDSGDFEYGYDILFEIKFTAGAPPPEPPPPAKIWCHAAWLEGFDDVATEDLPRKYYRVFGTPRVAQGGRFGEGGYLVMEDSGAALEWTLSTYDYNDQSSSHWTMGFAFRAPLSGWGDAVQEVGVCCWGQMDGVIGIGVPSIGVRKSWMKVSRAGVLGFGGIGANPAATATINLEEWTHVIAANDRDGFLRLYVNGVLVSKTSGTLTGGNALALGGADPVPQVAELHYDDWYIIQYVEEDAGDYNNILGDVRIKTAPVVGEVDPYPPVTELYYYDLTGDPKYLPHRWEAVGASSVAEAVGQRAVGNDAAYALLDASQVTEWGVPSPQAPEWDYSEYAYETLLASWLLLRVQAVEPEGTQVRSVLPRTYARTAGVDGGYLPYAGAWSYVVTTNQSIIDSVLAEWEEYGRDYDLETWDYVWEAWSFDGYDHWRVWMVPGLENGTPDRDRNPIYKHPISGYQVYDYGWTVGELNETYFGVMPENTDYANMKMQQFAVLYAVPVPH